MNSALFQTFLVVHALAILLMSFYPHIFEIAILLLIPHDKWAYNNLGPNHRLLHTQTLSFFHQEEGKPFIAFPTSIHSRIYTLDTILYVDKSHVEVKT